MLPTAPILRDGFAVGEIADSGQQYAGYAWRDAIASARAERVPIVYPRAGVVWRTDDGVTLTLIGPSLPFIESNNTVNDNSIAFILQYKRFRMLFTGDAGVAAEQRYLNERIDLHASVLKVGHHGSAYSSSEAFISAVHSRYAVVSVGRHNMFGHPAPSTLETLQRFDAQIYRTDENGAVQWSFRRMDKRNDYRRCCRTLAVHHSRRPRVIAEPSRFRLLSI